MPDLVASLLWAAGQVALVSLAAVVVSRRAAQRGPEAAAATAVVGMTAVLVLTALTFCPLPAWWDWPASPDVPDSEEPAAAPGPGAEGPRLAWPVALVGDGRRRLADAVAAPDGPGWSWRPALAVVLLGGAGLGLARLLAGVWAVRACVRRARPVRDPALLELVASLRAAMGCGPVEVRESAEVGGPAVAGWRRPVLLLPAGWADWDDDERRAVLAHELAHVRRGDWLAWLTARVGLALHFYQPFLHALARRLRLAQELAADALAAGFAGGPRTYLRALARLALRQQGAPCPAPAFLSPPGTLMRRIQMLRADRPCPSSRAWPGLVPAGLLVVACLAVSALRLPARAPRPEAAPDGADLISLIPADAAGVITLRPAALFARPGMKDRAALLNGLIKAGFKELGIRAGPGFKVEDIALLTAPLFLSTDDTKGGLRANLVVGLSSVRMGHDFDWEGWLKARVPGLTEEREGGKAFLKSGRDFPPVPPGICFHVADRRTLVLDTEQGMRMRLATKDRPPPPTWLADWERVGRAPLALALNPEHEEWRERLKAGDLSSSAMALFDHTTALAASVDCAEGKLVVRALAHSATEADRARARTAWQGLLAEGARAAADFQAEDEDSARTKQLRRLVEAVLRQNAVEEDGNRIRWRAEVRADAADLWDVLSFDNLPPVSD